MTPLWFLKAIAVSVIILTLLLKLRLKLSNIILLSIMFYFVALLSNSYYGIFASVFSPDTILYQVIHIIGKIWGTTRDGVFFGLIFVVLGLLLAKSKNEMSMGIIVVGMVVSTFCLLIEAYLCKRYNLILGLGDTYISLIFTTFFYMKFSLSFKGMNSNVFYHLRKLSMYIYYVHALFIFVFFQLLDQRLDLYKINSMLEFILILSLSLILGEIFIKHENNKFVRWLS